jgi:hypothetical protein
MGSVRVAPNGLGARAAGVLVNADLVDGQQGLGRVRDLLQRAENADHARTKSWVFWKSSGRFWGVKAAKTPVDMGFYVLGAALKFGIMSDVGIRQETASSVGRVFVRGLSGLRERSWRIR